MRRWRLGGERWAGERAGGEDGDGVGVVLVEMRGFFADDGDVGVLLEAVADALGEEDAVDGEGVAGGDGGCVSVGEQEGVGLAHLLLEQPGAECSDSDLREFEQTSSAKSAVWWASVERVGRIS